MDVKPQGLTSQNSAPSEAMSADQINKAIAVAACVDDGISPELRRLWSLRDALKYRIAQTDLTNRLVSTRFQFKSDVAARDIRAVVFDRIHSPFYEGERWAVRRGGLVLSKEGDWEYEPLPSSRDDDFYSRCRFESLEAAVAEYDRQGSAERAGKANAAPPNK